LPFPSALASPKLKPSGSEESPDDAPSPALPSPAPPSNVLSVRVPATARRERREHDDRRHPSHASERNDPDPRGMHDEMMR
jgi:hypothetical protein